MVLYHKTTVEAAAGILREGFRDGTGTYLTTEQHCGVWLSDRPDVGQFSGVLFELTFPGPDSELSCFEWIEEGKEYREWLIPSEFVNSRMSFKVIQED